MIISYVCADYLCVNCVNVSMLTCCWTRFDESKISWRKFFTSKTLDIIQEIDNFIELKFFQVNVCMFPVYWQW